MIINIKYPYQIFNKSEFMPNVSNNFNYDVFNGSPKQVVII